MPTARPTLDAAPREVTGKKVAHLRRAGRLPAVIYGHGVSSESVSLDTHEFETLRRKVGANALIDVTVDGKKPRPALVHGVQVDVLKRRPLHVDLFLVRMTEELTIDVRLVVTGTSEAVEKLNGTLTHLDHLRVRALPDHLPQQIELPIDSLVDFDSSVHVRDLTIPSDATLLTDPDEVAAKVLAPRIEIEEVAPAAEEEEGEGEEAAEGAAEAGEGAPVAAGESPEG